MLLTVESYQELGGLWNYEKADSPVSQNTHAIGHKTMQTFSKQVKIVFYAQAYM